MEWVKTKEEAIENLQANIVFIKDRRGFTSMSDLAAEFNIDHRQISNLKNGNFPTIFPFFARLCGNSGYTIEELLNYDLRMREEQMKMVGNPVMEESRLELFPGIYTAYYYSTSSMKGREKESDGESLKYGVLSIYQETETENKKDLAYKVVADFGLCSTEMEKIYQDCRFKQNTRENFWSAYMRNDSPGTIYEGDFCLTDEHIYMYTTASARDRVLMVMYRPKGKNIRFHGGLAACVSAATGREGSPTMQVIGIADRILPFSPEFIAKKLLLGYPSIKPSDEEMSEISELIKRTIRRRGSEEDYYRGIHFSEGEEYDIVCGAITRVVDKVVSRNLRRLFHISNIDDNDWYHVVEYAEEIENQYD